MKNELSRKIYNTKTIKKMEKRIKLLGVSSKMDAITFLNLRLFTSIILFFITIYIFNLGDVLTLTQADVFGNSVVDTMYNQIDYLREKRKLEVKASISKVPIKISVISVLFFVPLILLLILSPILISYLK